MLADHRVRETQETPEVASGFRDHRVQETGGHPDSAGRKLHDRKLREIPEVARQENPAGPEDDEAVSVRKFFYR